MLWLSFRGQKRENQERAQAAGTVKFRVLHFPATHSGEAGRERRMESELSGDRVEQLAIELLVRGGKLHEYRRPEIPVWRMDRMERALDRALRLHQHVVPLVVRSLRCRRLQQGTVHRD